MYKSLVIIIGLLTFFECGESLNKYSAEANQKHEKPLLLNPNVNFRTLEKPFRMAKLNMLWSKAQRVCTVFYIDQN